MSINKFPPKFSQNILYPAIYNLDEYDMPTGNIYGDSNMGDYFSTTFYSGGNPTMGEIPTLSYGKHKFKIHLTSDGDDFPKLKSRSRILFEIKDAADTVIFSDTTPIVDNTGFTVYLWIKQDPLRTYNDIVEGTAKLTIVGIAETTDNNWRNKYNVRLVQNITIDAYEQDSGGGAVTYHDNLSPVLFQNTTGSMGSGSGLFISESTYYPSGTGNGNQGMLFISASKMKTYSGEIEFIKVERAIKPSNGSELEWHNLFNYYLNDTAIQNRVYENNIYRDYGRGINTISEYFSGSISSIAIPSGEDPQEVRFRLTFYGYDNNVAKDPYTANSDFELYYPSNNDEWMDIIGSDTIVSNLVVPPLPSNTILLSSFDAEYNFESAHISISAGLGGQKYSTVITREGVQYGHAADDGGGNVGGGGGGNSQL